ncbi:MAG TPA: hypothetical protein VJG32_12950 [Anaerolineae bacterium]|nr:hypothetical protein [Anaerolineae bacterium]
MPARSRGGTVVYLQWTPEGGLSQTSATFSSLDELFELCLASGVKGHVEEIFIQGADQDGYTRQVTLTFRAASRPAA